MKPVYKARCHKDRSWKTGFYLIKKRQIVIKDEKKYLASTRANCMSKYWLFRL